MAERKEYIVVHLDAHDRAAVFDYHARLLGKIRWAEHLGAWLVLAALREEARGTVHADLHDAIAIIAGNRHTE